MMMMMGKILICVELMISLNGAFHPYLFSATFWVKDSGEKISG
jgi:hypothetical protein